MFVVVSNNQTNLFIVVVVRAGHLESLALCGETRNIRKAGGCGRGTAILLNAGVHGARRNCGLIKTVAWECGEPLSSG